MPAPHSPSPDKLGSQYPTDGQQALLVVAYAEPVVPYAFVSNGVNKPDAAIIYVGNDANVLNSIAFIYFTPKKDQIARSGFLFFNGYPNFSLRPTGTGQSDTKALKTVFGEARAVESPGGGAAPNIADRHIFVGIPGYFSRRWLSLNRRVQTNSSNS